MPHNTSEKSPSPTKANGDFDNHTNDVNSLTADDEGKAFSTLRARFALGGYALYRTDPSDGPVTFFTARWGLVRHLPTLDDVRRVVGQIGGKP